MTGTARDDVLGLRAQVERLQAQAADPVRGLSPARLDRSPAPGRWSVAGNFAHPAVVGARYFQRIHRSARTPPSRRPPASLFGRPSLMPAHGRRHLWQARQVRDRADFPAA